MKTLFCFRAYFTAIFVIFGDPAFSTPLNTNILNKKTLLEEKWDLGTTNPPNFKEMTSARNHLLEPQLITFLLRKLLTRTHDWKEHVRNVANSFVATYFNPENSSVPSKLCKAGKEATIQTPQFIPDSYKFGKKTFKRSADKPGPREEEIIKPFNNFSPVVQFIPANLDLSNKIMFYQPQLIINGSVYIEQNKDSKPSHLQEMFDLTSNRSYITNA